MKSYPKEKRTKKGGGDSTTPKNKTKREPVQKLQENKQIMYKYGKPSHKHHNNTYLNK